MANNPLPDPPIQLKTIQPYMKVASDIERIDPVASYWVRLYSTETALSIDRDSPDCKTFLGAIILWLEKFKQTHKDNETVSNQTVGQAHVENFVVSLFTKADTLDREGTANKTTIRMFYMAAVLFEAMAVFGPLTEEIIKKAKYAKFKAAYIQKCLKTGQTPKPGPVEGSDLEDPGAAQSQPDQATSSNSSMPDLPGIPTTKSESPTKPDPFILTPSSAPVYPPKLPSNPPAASTPSSTPSKPSEYTNPPSSLTSHANSFSDTTSSTGNNPTNAEAIFKATNGAALEPEDIIKSQKYCKFATSALQYDDIPTAVANLQKALTLLTTGRKAE